MKWNRILPVMTACAIHAQADSLNVVHLGPDKELGFETKAGDTDQKFTLPRTGSTGGFLLPPKKAAELSTQGDGAVSVKLPPLDEPRIAVLHPAGDSFAWRICTSKPTEGKFTLRLINLSKEKASVTIRDEVLDIAAEGELQAPSPQRTFEVEGSGKVTVPPSDEPGAVIAFLYKHEGTWQVHFFPDT
jgi:hypothetical protein